MYIHIILCLLLYLRLSYMYTIYTRIYVYRDNDAYIHVYTHTSEIPLSRFRVGPLGRTRGHYGGDRFT